MNYREYIYRLRKEDFYQFLLDYGKGVRLLEEGKGDVVFAVYEPLHEFEPIEVREIKAITPKEGFKPITLGGFVVLPPWLKPIFINPGSAFGTGLHPTTQLCLKAIEDFFQEGWSAIDVGCGSGILSIALKLKGANRVVAIDIDPQAVQECKSNAELNRVELEVYQAQPKDINQTFDFMVANLETHIFLEVMEDLVKLFERRAVLSGIYKKDELREILKLLKVYTLKVKKYTSKKGWFCLVVDRV
jgi:ribosomal protein L11 methyltransferase